MTTTTTYDGTLTYPDQPVIFWRRSPHNGAIETWTDNEPSPEPSFSSRELMERHVSPFGGVVTGPEDRPMATTMQTLWNRWNRWKQPRLMLMGMEAVEYPALTIWAHIVMDGSGNRVCGAHTKGEAERARDRFAVKYPQQRFYVQ